MRTSYGTRRAWAAVARRAAAAQKNDCCKRHDARRSSRSLRRRRAGAHMGLTRVRAARVQTQARTRGGGRRGITRGQGAHPLWIILVCTGASCSSLAASASALLLVEGEVLVAHALHSCAASSVSDISTAGAMRHARARPSRSDGCGDRWAARAGGGWCLNAPTGGKLPLVRRVAGV